MKSEARDMDQAQLNCGRGRFYDALMSESRLTAISTPRAFGATTILSAVIPILHLVRGFQKILYETPTRFQSNGDAKYFSENLNAELVVGAVFCRKITALKFRHSGSFDLIIAHDVDFETPRECDKAFEILALQPKLLSPTGRMIVVSGVRHENSPVLQLSRLDEWKYVEI